MNEVYVYENFLELSEQQYLLSVAYDSSNVWGAHPEEFYNSTEEYEKNRKDWWYGKLQKYNNDEILTNIHNRVNYYFNDYEFITVNNNIYRYCVNGEPMKAHKDVGVKYGIIIYINDNYEGGEIFYPEFNITYKPQERSMVVHSSESKHGVNSVKSGESRYFMTSFVLGNNAKVKIKGRSLI